MTAKEAASKAAKARWARRPHWMRLLDIKSEKEFYAAIDEMEAQGIETRIVKGQLMWV